MCHGKTFCTRARCLCTLVVKYIKALCTYIFRIMPRSRENDIQGVDDDHGEAVFFR